MDKTFESPGEAIADLDDGASITVSGFGASAGSPVTMLAALAERGSKDLTLVGNTIPPGAGPLFEQKRVRHLIMSFTARAGRRGEVEQQLESGQMTFELVPQGTLVERLRAGGAGLGGIYTPTGLNTKIAEGKDVRYFDGQPYILETAIRVDYAFIAGHRADRMGNVEFRGANQHFGPSFAKAARVAIVEVDEIVDVGEIPPERIGLPGIFVARVVRKSVENNVPKFGGRRPADVAREYNGKPGWTRRQMAEVAASTLPEPSYVNLGLGIPTLVSSFIGGRDIVLHGENGILGYGQLLDNDTDHPDVFNAGGQPVFPNPGIAYFDSVTAFEMVRSGRVHVVGLGAYQVDAEGSVANWATSEMMGGGIGGAMDMVANKKTTVMVLMEHRDSRDRPKVLERCTYPITGKACVDVLVTDLALFRRVDGRLKVDKVAPGFTEDEVLALTEMRRPAQP